MTTAQEKKWLGDHGKKYSAGWVLSPSELDKLWAERVTGGVTRTEIVTKMLAGLPKTTRILEVGCNVGNQLVLLRSLGFQNVWGVELIPEAVTKANERVPGRIIQGSAFLLPFGDKSFDLVMTCWCLSHIAPIDIKAAAREIKRVALRYIFITENYAPKERETIKDYLWQRDHLSLFSEPDGGGLIRVMTGNVLKHMMLPPAKPHPAAPSHKKGHTDSFLLELP